MINIQLEEYEASILKKAIEFKLLSVINNEQFEKLKKINGIIEQKLTFEKINRFLNSYNQTEKTRGGL